MNVLQLESLKKTHNTEFLYQLNAFWANFMLKIEEQAIPTAAQVRVQMDNTHCSVQSFSEILKKVYLFKSQSQLRARVSTSCCVDMMLLA